MHPFWPVGSWVCRVTNWPARLARHARRHEDLPHVKLNLNVGTGVVEVGATEDMNKVLSKGRGGLMEGGGGDSIFTEHMLASKNAQARAALEDVKEKHADIQKLEKSIEELHQLFVDLSVLVESQGELLDTIEYSVSQSLSYTKTGVQELEKANEYARKSRKKMCILIAILLVVVLVVLGPILHSVLG